MSSTSAADETSRSHFERSLHWRRRHRRGLDRPLSCWPASM